MKKASGSAGIPAELFQILNDDAVKVLHSICQQIWKTQLYLEKEEEPEIKFPTSFRSSKKKESSKKASTSGLLSTPKPLTLWITTNYGKFFKRWEYQTTLPSSLEICMQVKKQQLELDMEQQADSKSGKEHVKAVYCHPAYLILNHEKCWAR